MRGIKRLTIAAAVAIVMVVGIGTASASDGVVVADEHICC